MFCNVIPYSTGAECYHKFGSICWANFFLLEIKIFPLPSVGHKKYIPLGGEGAAVRATVSSPYFLSQ